MSLVLRSGGTTPNEALVNEDGRLQVTAVEISGQRFLSECDAQLYQVQFRYTITGAGTFRVATTENADAQGRDLVIFEAGYVWFGWSGGTTLPNVGDYIQAIRGQTYSGGDLVTNVQNQNLGSQLQSGAVHRENNPTAAGTAALGVQIPILAALGAATEDFKGRLILPPGLHFGLNLVTTQTAGEMYIRMVYGFHEQAHDCG